MYRKIDRCRVCESVELFEFLDLGSTEAADNFSDRRNHDEGESLKFPLTLNCCRNCGWHQLSIEVNATYLYQSDYPYDSRTTSEGKLHWADFAKDIVVETKTSPHDLKVLDVGSNTGALLSEFRELGCDVFGVDPSAVAGQIASNYGIPTIIDFFSEKSMLSLTQAEFYPNIIVATNSFLHVGDLSKWLKCAESIMPTNGLLVIEAPHVLELISKNQFDTVYHEHLSYLSVKPLVNFFKKHSLQITKVKKTAIHGGSIRIYARKIGYSNHIHRSVDSIINEEERMRIAEESVLKDFADRVQNIRRETRNLIQNLESQNLRWGIVSAPAKGMTFYSYVGLKDFSPVGISDKNPQKIGKYPPGIDMKVTADVDLISTNPEYLLVLAWNFKNEIKENLVRQGFRGSIITCIPKVEVLECIA